MIASDKLIALFERMYAERWRYEWGAAREGCVDCSGAFVYAYRLLGGPSIAHGSNTIYRTAIGETARSPTPGYAAFKVRYDSGEPKKYWPDGLGNAYHIGLVAADGKHVLNAKGTEYGFCRDSAEGWTCFAPLLAVERKEETNEQMTAIGTARVVTERDPLSIRAAARKDAAKRGSIPKEARVELLREEGEWSFVRYKGVTGYVYAKYLCREEAEAVTTIIREEDGASIQLIGRWTVANGGQSA